MLEYKPEKKMASLFEPFGVWIKGKRYEVKTLTFAIYDTLQKIADGAPNEETLSAFAIEVMGEEEYTATSPHNPLELQMLAMWMFKEFFGPVAEKFKEEKAEKEKNAGKTPA